MAEFKFSLEKVLNYREQLENEAKARLGSLQEKSRALKEHYRNLKEDEQIQENKLCNTPFSENGQRWLLDNYIKALRQDMLQTQKDIASVDEEIEQAKKELAEKAKDRKIMEKLKEKHFENFKKEEQLKEQRNLDEIASIRFKTQTY